MHIFPLALLAIQAFIQSSSALPAHSLTTTTTTSTTTLDKRLDQSNLTTSPRNAPPDPFIVKLGTDTLSFTRYRLPSVPKNTMQTFLYDLELAIEEQMEHERASLVDYLQDRTFFHEDEDTGVFFKLQAQPSPGDRLRWTQLQMAVRAVGFYLQQYRDGGNGVPMTDMEYTNLVEWRRVPVIFAVGTMGVTPTGGAGAVAGSANVTVS